MQGISPLCPCRSAIAALALRNLARYSLLTPNNLYQWSAFLLSERGTTDYGLNTEAMIFRHGFFSWGFGCRINSFGRGGSFGGLTAPVLAVRGGFGTMLANGRMTMGATVDSSLSC